LYIHLSVFDGKAGHSVRQISAWRVVQHRVGVRRSCQRGAIASALRIPRISAVSWPMHVPECRVSGVQRACRMGHYVFSGEAGRPIFEHNGNTLAHREPVSCFFQQALHERDCRERTRRQSARRRHFHSG
jgi:hypothetical protein